MVLLAVFLLQIKHFLCDFVFQTEYQVQNKAVYGHPAGLAHAGTHLLGTIPVLWLIGTPWGLFAALVAGEFVVHYHADWLKAQFDLRRGNERDRLYWAVFGFDQLIHQLTYVAMLYIVLRFDDGAIV